MANVKFVGAVSNQAAESSVVITVAKNGEPVESFGAATDAAGAFQALKEYPPGGYTAQAHIDADAMYGPADSPAVPFTVPLLDRSLTLNVSLE